MSVNSHVKMPVWMNVFIGLFFGMHVFLKQSPLRLFTSFVLVSSSCDRARVGVLHVCARTCECVCSMLVVHW